MSQPRQLRPTSEAQRPLCVGVDVGGTNIKLGLVDDGGSPVVAHAIATESERGPDDGVRRMADAIDQILATAGITRNEVSRVGLATPGTMDTRAGMLLEPHNLPGWFQYPIRERLAAACGRPVTFVNDANAAAYGEYWGGRGRGFHSLVFLTLGTGVGGGIIIGDLLVEGEHSCGAECGHIIVDPSPTARVCPCGKPGHLEAYSSATGVIARTKDELAAGRASSLAQRIAAGSELTPRLIAAEAEAGDSLSDEIVMETARFLGVGIATLLHVINPDGVVLGGAMTFGGNASVLGRRFLARIAAEIRERALPPAVDFLTLDFASLGGDAGYIGAAGLARLEHLGKR